MTVKEKLEAYRRKKHQQEMTESIKNAFRNVFSRNRDSGMEESAKKLIELESCMKVEDVQDADDKMQQPKSTIITKIIDLLYFLLWITLYMITLKYEFGAVYFVLSALIFIWCNTRSGPKQQGEPSAYSVFNPNCEAIDGTLDASQFEREIRYGIGGVH